MIGVEDDRQWNVHCLVFTSTRGGLAERLLCPAYSSTVGPMSREVSVLLNIAKHC